MIGIDINMNNDIIFHDYMHAKYQEYLEHKISIKKNKKGFNKTIPY